MEVLTILLKYSVEFKSLDCVYECICLWKYIELRWIGKMYREQDNLEMAVEFI